MGKEIYLHIKEPCHENWEAMSPDQQGRFCQSCAKHVIDFSRMSDQQILDILSKASGNTCGRFTPGQLERPMVEEKREIPFFLKPHKIALASMVPLFILSAEAPAQDNKLKGKVAVHQETACEPIIFGNLAVTKPDVSMIRGTVLTEDRKAIKQAIVSIKGTKTSTLTNISGNFSLRHKNGQKKFVLEITTPGYETAEVEIKNVEYRPYLIILKTQEAETTGLVSEVRKKAKADGPDTFKIEPKEAIVKGRIVNNHDEPLPQATVSINGLRKNITIDNSGYFSLPIEAGQTEAIISATHAGYQQALAKILLHKDGLSDVKLVLEQQPGLDTAIVVNYSTTTLKGLVGGFSIVETVTPKDTLKTWVQKIFRNELFTAFPNPVTRGQNLHLRFKGEGDYSLQLFDNSGRLYVEKQIRLAVKAQDFLLAMPASVGSGVYYLKAINTTSKKQYIEKIIVP